MKKAKLIISSALLLTCLNTPAQKIRVHTIGDSTMADYAENTTRTRGWGEMLQEFFDSTQVRIMNYARGGRSSHSFHHEGLWDHVKQNMQKGDYVLIQFAHNDEKEGGVDGADFRGTAPWTTYRHYLELYVDESRAKGAVPVFVTPIIRRYFDRDERITRRGQHDLGPADNDSVLNYVRVMETVAKAKNVPVVEMTELTRRLAEQLGKEATTRQIYVPTDGTHTQATGAAVYAQLASKEMKRMGLLAESINSDVELVLNPTSLNLGTLYAGDEAVQCFDLTGIALKPEAGKITLRAPKGTTISVDDDKVKGAAVVSLDYSDGKLWNRQFFLHMSPKGNKHFSDAIKVDWDGGKRKLPVTAEWRKPSVQTNVTIDNLEISTKGLADASGKAPVSIELPAEIDESAGRYVEFVVKATGKTLLLKKLRLTVDGNISYRIAYARGKDFYPRTDIGEQQRGSDGKHFVEYNVGTAIQPGAALHIRLFPWSVAGGKTEFSISDLKVDAVEME